MALFVQGTFYRNLPSATASFTAGRTKDSILFQRLSYIYDAITVGTLAGHEIDLPNIYHQSLAGAVAFMGGDSLHIVGKGFSVTYQDMVGTGHIEDRLLVAWTGEKALCAWLEAIEAAYYPAEFLTGNPPMPSPPPTWCSFTVHDEESQGILEREALVRTVAAWGYRTRSAPDENDDMARTYFFESAADAVYARMFV